MNKKKSPPNKSKVVNKSKSHYKNDPLLIEDHPLEAKVAPEIIVEEQPLVTVEKQRKPGYRDGVHVGTENLKPFQPGQSGNPSGRPPDLIKAIALRMAQLKAERILSENELEKLKRLGLDKAGITVIENIILDWATSGDSAKQQMFVERVGGKVPNINLNAEISAGLVTRFKSKLTDSELEAIANGADAMDILFDKLPDIDADVIDAE